MWHSEESSWLDKYGNTAIEMLAEVMKRNDSFKRIKYIHTGKGECESNALVLFSVAE